MQTTHLTPDQRRAEAVEQAASAETVTLGEYVSKRALEGLQQKQQDRFADQSTEQATSAFDGKEWPSVNIDGDRYL
ncbi:MAG: hypothetical protein RL341_2133, partial [Pseudomonadota bacterium]